MKEKLKKIFSNTAVQNIGLILLILFGATVLIYPDIAHWQSSRRHHAMMQTFSEGLEELEQEIIDAHFDRAIRHNNNLDGIAAVDPFSVPDTFVAGSGIVLSMEYYDILNFNGIMGRIEIPRIGVNLPIFHGTSSEVLDRGVGHMSNTPFPIGGYGNHSILSAHTGLASHRLFNDLPLLEVGDIFIVTILNERFAYEVDQLNIVLPHEIESIYSDANHDWMTLVTCTPYGINSHRYLVRGFRIPYIIDMAEHIEDITNNLNMRIFIITGFAKLFTITLIAITIKDRKLTQEARFDLQIEKEYELQFGKLAVG